MVSVRESLFPLATSCRLMCVNWFIIWIILGYAQSNELPKLSNTTYLLDSLLSEDKYDRKIRPGLGGAPIVISTNIEIRSFGPISESQMVYSMDCYFRQTWSDPRLKFRSHQEKLSMDWKFLQKVWIPDTYFLNGKSSYLHKITVPNKFIRLRKDGVLSYSMRLTIKASCPMHLRKYPLDTQACPLEIGSYAYPTDDVMYEWSAGKDSVTVSKDVTLSQYEFVDILPSTRINSVKVGGRTDERSILVVYFVIRRNRGYYLLQIYAPCSMIVGASWVSFWINRSDAAGRVAVGATTVLTMVTMGFGGKREKVSTATAIDWFVIMCFTFVFSALVEYAFVNYIDNYEKQQAKKQLELDKEKKKKEEEEAAAAAAAVAGTEPTENAPTEGFTKIRPNAKDNYVSKKTSDRYVRQRQRELERLMQGKTLSYRRRTVLRGRLSLGKRGYRNRHIASKMDSYARVVFPVTFLILNVMYWTLYLLILDDEISLKTRPNPYVTL